MKNIKKLLFLPLFLSLAFHVIAQQKTLVVGYLPTWSNFALNSQNLDFNKYSHINISFANPDSEGNLDEGLQDAVLDDFIARAHSGGTKVLVSVGGAIAPESWRELMKTENRTPFIQKIMDYLILHDYDGIDVDLEGNDITTDYDEFVTELSVQLQSEGMVMTAALAQWTGNRISDQAMFAFDFINIMAYDATGGWDLSNPGQHSSMAFAQQNLDYWTGRGYPADDCVLGVPFYGYDFNASGRYLSYREIVNFNQGAVNLDQIDQIYYNGKPTIGAKTVLAIENYGGIMIWEITQDIEGEHSLIDTIYNTILNENYEVGIGNKRPRVSLSSPFNNQVIIEGSSLVVESNAFDTDGNLAFSALLLNEDTIAKFFTEGPYVTTISNMALGNYEISIYSVDDQGASGVSDKTLFTVEKSKPQIQIISPINLSSTSLDQELTIEVEVKDTVGNITFAAILVDGDTLEKFSSGGLFSTSISPSTTGFAAISCYAENDLGGVNTSSLVYVAINGVRMPFNGSPSLIPGTIEAEEYDFGGYRVSYFDRDIENKGGEDFRSEDAVDIEGFGSSQYNVGYLTAGEWLEYTITVSESDSYDIIVNNASAISGGRFTLSLDGLIIASSRYLSATGGWSSFKETSLAQDVFLEKGEYILKFQVVRVGFNIDYFRFKKHEVVGITNVDNKALGNMYPNPMLNELTIEVDNGVDGILNVYDLTGVLVYEGALTEVVNKVDLSFLNNGTYLVQLIQGGENQIVKVVKE